MDSANKLYLISELCDAQQQTYVAEYAQESQECNAVYDSLADDDTVGTSAAGSSGSHCDGLGRDNLTYGSACSVSSNQPFLAHAQQSAGFSLQCGEQSAGGGNGAGNEGTDAADDGGQQGEE